MGEKRKVFVGNIPFGTDDESLREKFEDLGEVEEAIIIYDRETGKSRGFGFVTFKNQEDAAKAIDNKTKVLIDERELNINPANDKNERGGGGRSYRGRGYSGGGGYSHGGGYRDRNYGQGGGGHSGRGYGGGYGSGGGDYYQSNRGGGGSYRDY